MNTVQPKVAGSLAKSISSYAASMQELRVYLGISKFGHRILELPFLN